MTKKSIITLIISFLFFALVLQAVSYYLNKKQVTRSIKEAALVQETVTDRFKLFLRPHFTVAVMAAQYFDKNDQDQWVVKSSLRSGITFQKLNLLHHWGYIGPFDIIFCRNVLIYQSVENKIKIIKEIWNHLNAGGYLVLGAAESLFGLSQDFDQLVHGTAVFYRKKS